MPDWTKSMEQSFEYYTVEPTTLADIKRLDNVKKAAFSRDYESQTLGSATIDVTNTFGESYIRGYLKTIQNGVTEKFPLGTVLSQTPSSSFNGKITDISMDCYTPLIELKEKKPPLGYTVRKGSNIMDAAYNIVKTNCRVPVEKVARTYAVSEELIAYPYVGNRSTADGITFTDNGDGSITINGSPINGIAEFVLKDYFTLELEAGTYVLSGGFSSAKRSVINTEVKMTIVDPQTENMETYVLGLEETTISLDTDGIAGISIFVQSGDTLDNVTIRPSVKKSVDISPTLQYDFVADTNDTYLSFVIALIANANYELGLGERGNILFMPKQELESLQPVWTFNDDNSSILLPDITVNHDLYGIPNVVEVIYSYGSDYKRAVAVNNDPNSPTSTISRGREIPYYDTDPSLRGYVTQDQLNAYAERVLKALSTLEYTVSFTHAYCPVRIGDCVRLNYTRAGIKNIKAKIISQNIKAEPGCQVSTKAVFKSKLWR